VKAVTIVKLPARFMKKKLLYWGKTLLFFVPFLCLVFLLKTKTGHTWDTSCWIRWATQIYHKGLSYAYRADYNNYLFVYQYILWIYTKLQGSLENVVNNIYQLKNFTILFDFATTLILFTVIREKNQDHFKSAFLSLFYFLNIAILYNSIIWGQIDGIMTFFVALSFFCIYRKKLLGGLFFIFIAINTKFQSIIFLPIILLLAIPLIKERNGWIKLLFSIMSIFVCTAIVYYPFVKAGDFQLMWQKTLASTIGHSPYASANAYNFWYLILKENPNQVSDTTLFLGISYRLWGVGLFAIGSLIALFHFIKPTFKMLTSSAIFSFTLQKVIISSALIPLLFFFFNTEMHDRFPYPMLIFLMFYAILYHRPIPYILTSIAYLLNLDAVLKYFNGSYHTLVYMPEFVACIYLISIILLFIELLSASCPQFCKTITLFFQCSRNFPYF